MPDLNDVVRHVILRIVVDQAGLGEDLAIAREKVKALQSAERTSNRERVKDAETVTEAYRRQRKAREDALRLIDLEDQVARRIDRRAERADYSQHDRRNISTAQAETAFARSERAQSRAVIAQEIERVALLTQERRIMAEIQALEARTATETERRHRLTQQINQFEERARQTRRAGGTFRAAGEFLRTAQEGARAFADAKEDFAPGGSPRGSRLRNAFDAAERDMRGARGPGNATSAFTAFFGNLARDAETNTQKAKRALDGLRADISRRAQFQGFLRGLTEEQTTATTAIGRIRRGITELRQEARRGGELRGIFGGLRLAERDATSALARVRAGIRGVFEYATRSEAEGRGNFLTRLADDFENVAKSVSSRSGGLFRLLFSFRGVILLVVAAFGPLAAILGAVGAAALGLASNIAVLSGALLALPGLIGAAIAGFGVLALVLTPLSKVFDAYAQKQKAAATATAEGTSAAARAALALREAQLDLEQAQLRSTRAQEDAARAQLKLNEARRDAARRIEDYRTSLARLRFQEEGAQLGVESAQQALRRAAADPTANNLDRKIALHNVEGAVYDQQDQVTAGRRLREDAATAISKGVDGSDEVIAANRAIKDSANDLEEAEIQLQKAILGVNKAKLEQAAGGAENLAFEKELDKLPAKTRKVVEAIIGLNDEFKKMRDRLSEKIFGPVSDDTGRFASVLESLEDYLGPTATALGELADKALKLFTNPDWKAFFSSQGEENGKIIAGLGDAALSAADGFREIVEQARPFTEFVVGGIKGFAEDFKSFVTAKDDGKKGPIQRFLELTKQTMLELKPVVRDFFKGLFGFLSALNDSSGANDGKSFTTRFNEGLGGMMATFAKLGEKARDPNGGFQKWLRDVGPLLKDVVKFLGQAGDFFGDLFSNPANLKEAQSLLKAIGERWLPALASIFDKLSTSGVISKIANAIGAMLEVISTWLDNGGADALRLFADGISFIATFIKGLLDKVPLLVTALGLLSVAFAGFVTASLIARFTGLLQILKGAVGLVRSLAKFGITGTFDRVRDRALGRDLGTTTARRDSRRDRRDGNDIGTRAANRQSGTTDLRGTGGVVSHLSRIETLLINILRAIEKCCVGGSGSDSTPGRKSKKKNRGASSGGRGSRRGGGAAATAGGVLLPDVFDAFDDDDDDTPRRRSRVTVEPSTGAGRSVTSIAPINYLPGTAAPSGETSSRRNRSTRRAGVEGGLYVDETERLSSEQARRDAYLNSPRRDRTAKPDLPLLARDVDVFDRPDSSGSRRSRTTLDRPSLASGLDAPGRAVTDYNRRGRVIPDLLVPGGGDSVTLDSARRQRTITSIQPITSSPLDAGPRPGRVERRRPSLFSRALDEDRGGYTTVTGRGIISRVLDDGERGGSATVTGRGIIPRVLDDGERGGSASVTGRGVIPRVLDDGERGGALVAGSNRPKRRYGPYRRPQSPLRRLLSKLAEPFTSDDDSGFISADRSPRAEQVRRGMGIAEESGRMDDLTQALLSGTQADLDEARSRRSGGTPDGAGEERAGRRRRRGRFARAGGLASRVGGGLVRGLAGGLVGAALSGAVALGGDYLTNKFVKNDEDAGSLSRGLGAVASGAGIGATIGSIIPGVGTVVGGAIGGLAGGAYSLYKDKNLRDFVGGKISGGAKAVGGFLSRAGGAIGDFFTGGDEATGSDGKRLGGLGKAAAVALGPLGGLLGKTDIGKEILTSLQKAGKGIADFFTRTIPTFFKRGVKGIHDFFTVTLPSLPGKAFDAITTGFGFLLGFFVKTLPRVTREFFTETIPNAASDAWNFVVTNLWDPFVAFIRGIPGFFTETIPQWFDTANKWIDDKIRQPLRTFIFDTIPAFFTETIPKWFAAAPQWFRTHVIEPVSAFFTETIPKFFTETLPAAITGLPKFLFDNLVQPILDFFGGLRDHVGDFLRGSWDWARSVFQRGASNVEEGYKTAKMSGGLIEGVYQGIEDTVKSRVSVGEFVVRRAAVNRPYSKEFLRDYNEGRFDPAQLYAGLTATTAPAMSLVPQVAASMTGAVPAVVNHTVNHGGLSMGDVTINNPVREKSERSLRRQIQIAAIRHRG